MLLKIRTAFLNAVVMVIFIASAGLPCYLKAQVIMPLTDLSSFKSPGKSWSIAGNVFADLSEASKFTVASGSGILVNMPVDHNGADLYTNAEYDDIDLELDYLMAKGSNSGIYLQGRYEIQLMDSWVTVSPKPGDNGGIYPRWDESRPQGQKGYEGYAARQNVSKAPGLWQHIRISFQAPRFDAAGNKKENARIIRIDLNGVTIHENLELSGPTRGAMANNEQLMGPLRFQGDHGAAAFRNIKISSFNKPRPELNNLKYNLYKGNYYDSLNLAKLPSVSQGTLSNLSAAEIKNFPEQYFIKYTGTINIKVPGEYNFNVTVPGGLGILKIDNKTGVGTGRFQRNVFVLPAGSLPFEILYSKNQDWSNRSIGLNISGPGIREFVIGDALSSRRGGDPILMDAPVNTMLRSFMDVPGGKRVVHAISVGTPKKIHYTYNLENGSIVQVWRGDFLDATPMWYGRGDGSSRPLGAVQYLENPIPVINQLSTADAPWIVDSALANYTAKGYKIDKNDLPSFLYSVFGAQVEDAIKPLDSGEGFKREIEIKNAANNTFLRIAEATNIAALNSNTYIINDKAYYIRIDEASGAKPVIRNLNGRKELIVPIQSKIGYSILF